MGINERIEIYKNEIYVYHICILYQEIEKFHYPCS